jgi:hypothetical protein
MLPPFLPERLPAVIVWIAESVYPVEGKILVVADLRDTL